MLKVDKEYANRYVGCLPEKVQKEIKDKVEESLNTLSLSKKEKEEALTNAMNSKVCDLTNTIEIEFC